MTPVEISKSLFFFVLAGLFEIGGGYLMWLWLREEATPFVDDLIALVGAVDGILQVQSKADTEYFAATMTREFTEAEMTMLEANVLKAYRWQYIVSGVQHPRFQAALGGMINEAHGKRIGAALAPIM